MCYNIKSCLRCCLMFCNRLHVFERSLCHCLQHFLLYDVHAFPMFCYDVRSYYFGTHRLKVRGFLKLIYGLLYASLEGTWFLNVDLLRLYTSREGAWCLNVNFLYSQTSPEGAWFLKVMSYVLFTLIAGPYFLNAML